MMRMRVVVCVLFACNWCILVDEDFQIKSKDVPSDVSSEASSDDSDAVAEEMDTTDIKEVGESDSDVEVANASKRKLIIL